MTKSQTEMLEMLAEMIDEYSDFQRSRPESAAEKLVRSFSGRAGSYSSQHFSFTNRSRTKGRQPARGAFTDRNVVAPAPRRQPRVR